MQPINFLAFERTDAIYLYHYIDLYPCKLLGIEAMKAYEEMQKLLARGKEYIYSLQHNISIEQATAECQKKDEEIYHLFEKKYKKYKKQAQDLAFDFYENLGDFIYKKYCKYLCTPHCPKFRIYISKEDIGKKRFEIEECYFQCGGGDIEGYFQDYHNPINTNKVVIDYCTL